MRVSFVVPTRNQARFLRRALDSCLEQEGIEGEVIVVDGLSTDGTQAILAAYGDRIAWTSERDNGQADAVNKGIARARGEIVAWLNSDDAYADRSVLADVRRAFEAGPEVDVVYGGTLLVTADGEVLRPHHPRPVRAAAEVLIHATAPAMQPAIFFRRALFDAVGGLRTDLHYAMDYDLWLRMFPRARGLRLIPRPLALATFHPDAKSVAGVWKQVRELAVLKRLHRGAFALSWADGLRLRLGVASLYAYAAAVRLGLRRVS